MALKYILASMDGMSTAAFRSLCFEYGADGATTEMIPAPGFARAKRKRRPILDALALRRPEETMLAAQIIGSDPETMAAAARKLEELNRFDAIEINMGCPARTVVSSGNGSALLMKPDLARRILHEVCAAVQLPVRLKMRVGWDDDHITAPEIARIAQEEGVRELILHGRTREQQYLGEVNPEYMLRVRDAVSMPIYANGAVTHARDAAAFARSVGAQGVCIGRAALKNPWIFQDIRLLEQGKTPPERDAQERIGMLLKLAERLCMQKPEHFAMQELRKNCRWYLSGLSGADEAFDRAKYVLSLDEFRAIYSELLEKLIQTNDMHLHPELMPEETLHTVRRG